MANDTDRLDCAVTFYRPQGVSGPEWTSFSHRLIIIMEEFSFNLRVTNDPRIRIYARCSVRDLESRDELLRRLFILRKSAFY